MEQTTYKIGEAAALLNLKTYVLRFWETEFPQISPLRTEKGQRLYTRKDIELLKRIRFLLHERGLTIEGARRILFEESAKGGHGPGPMFSVPLTLYAADDAGRKSSSGTLDGETLEEDTAHPYGFFPSADGNAAPERARADAGAEGDAPVAKPVEPINRHAGPNSPEQRFCRDIINELEDVAAMLRGRPKTGNYLQ